MPAATFAPEGKAPVVQAAADFMAPPAADLQPRRRRGQTRRLSARPTSSSLRGHRAPAARARRLGRRRESATRGSSVPRREPAAASLAASIALVTDRAPARPRDGPEAAVQVSRVHAGRILGHGRAGDRLLRPVPALLRPCARRVPPAPRHAADGLRRRARHARLEHRVPRAGALRRLLEVFIRVARIGRTSATYEMRRLPGRGRRADGDRDARRSCSSTSRSARRARSRTRSASESAPSKATTRRSERSLTWDSPLAVDEDMSLRRPEEPRRPSSPSSRSTGRRRLALSPLSL